MTKILILSAALLAGTTVAAVAQSDKSVQGRPMGGLAISMQQEQAMEAASMARGKPQAMHKHHTMMKHHMTHRAM